MTPLKQYSNNHNRMHAQGMREPLPDPAHRFATDAVRSLGRQAAVLLRPPGLHGVMHSVHTLNSLASTGRDPSRSIGRRRRRKRQRRDGAARRVFRVMDKMPDALR